MTELRELAADQERQTPEAYSRAWESYRWRCRVVMLAAVFVPLFGMISNFFIPAQDGGTVPGGVLGFLLALPLWMVATLSLEAWQCPRCHHNFFQSDDGWHHGVRSRWLDQCAKCGLPKWSIDPNAPRG